MKVGVGSVLLLLVAACADAGVRPQGSLQSADSADQIMVGMSTQLTEKGVLRSFLEADTAYVYQNQQITDLRHFKVRMLDAHGNLQSTLTADHGLYTTYSGKLDARGHVMVESTDGRRLWTEHLIYDKTANQIRSDTAFTYDSPTAKGSGKSFLSDIEFRNLTIDQPKGGQKGKGILLPGQ
ncbi:MAG TPA: LPS export ABC transporter periplasmic protein LptC [Gemmatimonadales bacterium]|jgi:LPS export ABC transporter protein LptC